ncbi:MAG: NAD/NADP-dependent betaine aldehyde dehydrogenase [Sodalis sp.]|nr:MAG: NAD/NADP-dependent betaine aldehyde dehydrogenase [Sodalis sp.]
MDEALAPANDSGYGLGVGAWSRDINTAIPDGRGIQAGRIWFNCYHTHPAHLAFAVIGIGHCSGNPQNDA